MSAVSPELLEIGRSFDPAYRPVLSLDGWLVAMLRHFAVVDAAHLERLERHRLTDEVFVLTAGTGCLILLDDRNDSSEGPATPQALPMELHVAYNVRRKVWHHVLLSPEAHVVIFERSDTGPENTDYMRLDPSTIAHVRQLWGAQKP